MQRYIHLIAILIIVPFLWACPSNTSTSEEGDESWTISNSPVYPADPFIEAKVIQGPTQPIYGHNYGGVRLLAIFPDKNGKYNKRTGGIVDLRLGIKLHDIVITERLIVENENGEPIPLLVVVGKSRRDPTKPLTPEEDIHLPPIPVRPPAAVPIPLSPSADPADFQRATPLDPNTGKPLDPNQ